jgi:cyclophilin family peptidyl-prolyl cis-trans isomerase
MCYTTPNDREQALNCCYHRAAYQLRCDLVPKTCENFLGLCAKGYYNNVIFHRLIRNFMVCPLSDLLNERERERES